MINFVFGTLGSVVFWVLYLGISVFVTTAIIKSIAKETFSFLTGGDKHLDDFLPNANRGDEFHPYVKYTAITLVNFIFWPLVLVGLLAKFVVPNVLLPLIKKMVISVDKLTPTVKFEKKKDTAEDTPKSSKDPDDAPLNALGELEDKITDMLKTYNFVLISVSEILLTGFINMVNSKYMYYKIMERNGNTIDVLVSKTKEGIDNYEHPMV